MYVISYLSLPSSFVLFQVFALSHLQNPCLHLHREEMHHTIVFPSLGLFYEHHLEE